MATESLQETYTTHFLKWESYLSNVAQKIRRELYKSGLKFSIKSRIKTIESLNVKRIQLENLNAVGSKKIKDLLGLRTIVPFQEDVEQIIDMLHNKFEVIEIERKSENLSYREFAYDSVHVIIAVDDENFAFPQPCTKCCEIQIRTILQDAWAEVEHELIYKSDLRFYNESTRKKLAALNANLTLSDMIFQEIKDVQKESKKWGQERFQELQKKAAQINANEVSAYISKEKDLPSQKDTSNSSKASDKKLDRTLMEALENHNQKNYKKAIELYSQALDFNPNLKIRSIIYHHRGMANFMLHSEHRALQDFDISFQCDSTNYRALNNRALVLRRMGHITESLEDFKLSLELKKDQPEVYYLRAQTNFELTNYNRALEDLTASLKLNPTYQPAIELMKHVSNKMAENSEDSASL
ncbi:MAG: hypothetical protein HQM14_17440 [SAR324 cluster bacterium]|nr:hypothetical protein [SAR324 cluster bacterium]